ncbi:PREDICTED: venom dipeptidyl peptidase 4-like [Papilio polytes]|uniref:venom dipeptidyl peptidase 4-like n=1 Tax=Papilio polytes TaxID=76194 RepID=UPI0006762EB1|nr:PREDICTED: venom dipeptidyl peptidase 4-like [Papilio polytes]
MARTFVILLSLTLMGCLTESSLYTPFVPKTFNLEEIVPLQADFYPERVQINWISDTEYIVREHHKDFRKYDAVTDTFVTILNESDWYNLNHYAVSSYSKDLNYFLLAANMTKVYRHSTLADYYVYDIELKTKTKIGQGRTQVVVWGAGDALAYVENNNVYYIPNVARPHIVTALTSTGIPGELYHGATDWIYEEEVFNAPEALWFSPNDSYLAVASFDDRDVESAIYQYYGNPSDIDNQYPQLVQFKYPKVGRTNPVVSLRVYNLSNIESDPLYIPAPVDVIGLDHILGRVNWATDHNLIVLWLNRRQNVSILINCDLINDKCSMIQEHTERNGWIDIPNPYFDSTGSRMLEIQPMLFNDQRFPHAALFDFNTLATTDLSPGNSTVTSIVGWNDETDTVYYIVSPWDLPWQRQLWATSQGVSKCISCRDPTCRNVVADFSPEASYGIMSCSGTNSPPVTYLYNAKTNGLKIIVYNNELSEKLRRYRLPMALFNSIALDEDIVAHVKLLLPPEMQEGKKYPMVLRVYSGPGTTRVKDNFNLEYYASYLSTNRSFIVASIDVRGSGAMGVEAMHAVNNALGTVEITDTLSALERLISIYPFIDPDRIGVWGWSYGGYASTMMLVKDDVRLLACGAAVAPVTSWLYYDSIYTERYMDTPQANPLGYKQSDLLSAAQSLRGRRYLLVHGSGDDNVHYQHSLQLAKQLQHADISFEQLSYTDENHSLAGVSRHFYHALDHFWTECFDQ